MAPIIGFDFDDCLTNAYSILPIILFLETLLIKELRAPGVSKDTRLNALFARSRFYDALAENEVRSKGTIIRPSFLNIFPQLMKLRREGRIQGLFIYSNNMNESLIEVVDHILALTLVKLGVPESHLIPEPYGSVTRIHALSPRFFRNSPCRSGEALRGDFKEKTLSGIISCLGTSVPESDVWFLDDTVDHKSLMSSIKSNYIDVKKYEISLKNFKIAEMLSTSFPKDAFNPSTEMGRVFMAAYSVLERHFIITPPGEKYLVKANPRFNPKGMEDAKKRTELLQVSLNAMSPHSRYGEKLWPLVERTTDTSYLLKKLDPILNPGAAQVVHRSDPDLATATASAYRQPLVGGDQESLKPLTSRSRRNRRLLTRRRKLE